MFFMFFFSFVVIVTNKHIQVTIHSLNYNFFCRSASIRWKYEGLKKRLVDLFIIFSLHYNVNVPVAPFSIFIMMMILGLCLRLVHCNNVFFFEFFFYKRKFSTLYKLVQIHLENLLKCNLSDKFFNFNFLLLLSRFCLSCVALNEWNHLLLLLYKFVL